MRVACSAVVVLVGSSVVAACSSDQSTTQPTDTTSSAAVLPRTISVQDLTFTLPPELTFTTDGFTSTGESIDGFYANVPLGPACSQSCGLSSFNPLPANAVVVGVGELSGFGIGGRNPGDPAPNTSIAGRTAVFSADKPGTCGGDETITARIFDPSENDYVVHACLRGPDLTAAEQTVHTLLASARFSGP